MKFNSETKFIGHFNGPKILDVIKENLRACDEFQFSVSFIKTSGFVLLKESIIDALNRGAVGTIITTDYMRITDKECLDELYALTLQYRSNFSAYFLETKKSEYKSFHTKGYVFKQGNVASIIIGSSNISGTALGNEAGEWSLYSKTFTNDLLFKDIAEEFKLNADSIYGTLTEAQIENYISDFVEFDYGNVAPNYMQTEALKCLNDLRVKRNKHKALVVAAMGSGKTYLAAFDTKNFRANHILYLCHSETVLSKAKLEFENVYKESKTYGFYCGGKKQKDRDIIFATNQSLYKNLNDFSKDYFDYIIIDEAHHAPADTFNTIRLYFNADFVLGMTGTPDRNDRKSARACFDDEVPYELNLRNAIEYKLIMPFVYHSVYDDLINYSTKTSESSIVSDMTTSDHGLFVKKMIETYRPEINGELKCLGFCVNIEHAKAMSSLMNRLGYNTAYITGSTPQEERVRLFKLLQKNTNELEILFSCNVMNEGVDLPDINMSLFLRPTESSIIFIQQLGRSLRFAENKNKPVIIDFIGNKYERSIYIAWALGELTNAPVLTKPILKRLINGDFKTLKENLGVELDFDEQSKKEISDFVDHYNFNKLEVLKRSYEDFKKYYNFTANFPCQMDFVTCSSGFDLMRIIKKHKSYYHFLHMVKELNVPKFNKVQIDFIDYLSDLLPLSRPHEFLIVRTLIENGPMKVDDLRRYLKDIIRDNKISEDAYLHAIDYLLLRTESEKNQLKKPHYLHLSEDGVLSLGVSVEDLQYVYESTLAELDLNDSEFRKFLLDLLNYGIFSFYENHKLNGEDFELYNTYSRKDFTRLALCKSVYSFMTGIYYYNDGNKIAFFVDLIKKNDVAEHLDYEDKFLSKKILQWESQTETIIGENKYLKLIDSSIHGDPEIFVRRTQTEDSIGLPFVYIGRGKLDKGVKSKNPNDSVTFRIELENELPDYLYEQFRSDYLKSTR